MPNPTSSTHSSPCSWRWDVYLRFHKFEMWQVQVGAIFSSYSKEVGYIAANWMFHSARGPLNKSQRFGERNVAPNVLPISPKGSKRSFDVSVIAAEDTFGVATLVRSKHDVVWRRISKSGGIAKFGAHLAGGIPSGNSSYFAAKDLLKSYISLFCLSIFVTFCDFKDTWYATCFTFSLKVCNQILEITWR